MGVIDNGQHYETLIVGGGGELELLDKVAGRVLEGPKESLSSRYYWH